MGTYGVRLVADALGARDKRRWQFSRRRNADSRRPKRRAGPWRSHQADVESPHQRPADAHAHVMCSEAKQEQRVRADPPKPLQGATLAAGESDS